MSNRTFVAVPVPGSVKRCAAELVKKLGYSLDGIRWVEEEQLYFTLNFLGEIGDMQLVDVCRSVQRIAEETEPFEISVAGAGAFPKPERPRVLWIGADAGRAELIALQEELTTALLETGAHLDTRPYTPHLTLGRVAGDGDREKAATLQQRILENKDFDAGTMPVRELIVFASELSRTGPVYHVLSRTKLGG